MRVVPESDKRKLTWSVDVHLLGHYLHSLYRARIARADGDGGGGGGDGGGCGGCGVRVDSGRH